MSRKKRKGAKVVDLPRIRQALANLDELVKKHPKLTSPEARERLSKKLDDDHDGGDGGSDGSQEDDQE